MRYVGYSLSAISYWLKSDIEQFEKLLSIIKPLFILLTVSIFMKKQKVSLQKNTKDEFEFTSLNLQKIQRDKVIAANCRGCRLWELLTHHKLFAMPPKINNVSSTALGAIILNVFCQMWGNKCGLILLHNVSFEHYFSHSLFCDLLQHYNVSFCGELTKITESFWN